MAYADSNLFMHFAVVAQYNRSTFFHARECNVTDPRPVRYHSDDRLHI